MEIKVENLRDSGAVECPRCRLWHGNDKNPLATTTRKKGKGDKQQIVTTVSPICDTCCNSLLEAFADPDWRLFWPDITDEEAYTIVNRILASKERQRQ
jgi:hypothetical protein